MTIQRPRPRLQALRRARRPSPATPSPSSASTPTVEKVTDYAEMARMRRHVHAGARDRRTARILRQRPHRRAASRACSQPQRDERPARHHAEAQAPRRATPALLAGHTRRSTTQRAQRLVTIAKALADPVRLRLVDVLRDHPGKVCPCELVPLFELSQPTISHHLKILRDAGVLDSEKHGLFVYYYVNPGALAELAAWLHPEADVTG